MNQLFPNYANLSQEDPIEQLNLSNRSFNALTRADIRTVGQVLQLVKSGGLQTTRGLGRERIYLRDNNQDGSDKIQCPRTDSSHSP